MVDRLQLRRPLAFLDIESTGTSPARDRIVEIAILKFDPNGSEEFRCKRVNPRVPIPPAATAVHGISDADVADEPGFGAYAKAINDFLQGCDLAGYGIRHFDLPLLRREMQRTREIEFTWRERAVVDAMTIFHKREPRDLAAAVRRFRGGEFERAHSALNDVRATVEVLRGQLTQYDDLPNDVEALHLYCNPDDEDFVDHDGRLRWEQDEVVITFGKYEGRSLRSVASEDREYLEWLLSTDFEREIKEIVRGALNGHYPAR